MQVDRAREGRGEPGRLQCVLLRPAGCEPTNLSLGWDRVPPCYVKAETW